MENLILIPEKTLNELLSNQEEILRLLQKANIKPANSSLSHKYISEMEAKNILNKGTTWFWQQRTQGKLAYSKVGNKIYYKKSDIDKLFENNSYETF